MLLCFMTNSSRMRGLCVCVMGDLGNPEAKTNAVALRDDEIKPHACVECMCVHTRADLGNSEAENNAVALHDDELTVHAGLKHSPSTQRKPAP